MSAQKLFLNKKILALILILIAIGISYGLMQASKLITPDEKLCQTDADCKPSGCHTKTCVNKEFAPDVMCTMVCMPNTLDCGQGECKCVNNRCEAVMK